MLADQAGWDQEQRLAVKAGLNSVQELLDRTLATGVLNYERSQHVASLIRNGKAVAVGFAKGTTEPEIVPPYLFETDSFIRWSQNEVAGNGFHFVSVRVAKLRRSEQMAERAAKPPVPKKLKVGRPPSVEISDIIRELNSDPNFAKSKRKSQLHTVLEIALQKYPDRFANGKDISPATVYRYLRKILGR